MGLQEGLSDQTTQDKHNDNGSGQEENTTQENNDESADNHIEEGGVEELTVIRQKLKEKEDLIIDLENKNSELQKKVEEYENLIRRKQAEFENYKKRTLREREDFQKTANQKIIEELLPIVDNLEQAINSSNEQGDTKELKEGIILIDKKLKKVLDNNHVLELKSIGEEFDPNFHEALQIDESVQDYEHDTVIMEWQKGYLIGDKVIRHAKVVVAKGTKNNEPNTNQNTKLDIPTKIDKNKFEEDVLAKLKDDDKKKIIESAYEQNDKGDYILKEELNKNEEEKKNIAELLDSISF